MIRSVDDFHHLNRTFHFWEIGLFFCLERTLPNISRFSLSLTSSVTITREISAARDFITTGVVVRSISVSSALGSVNITINNFI